MTVRYDDLESAARRRRALDALGRVTAVTAPEWSWNPEADGTYSHYEPDVLVYVYEHADGWGYVLQDAETYELVRDVPGPFLSVEDAQRGAKDALTSAGETAREPVGALDRVRALLAAGNRLARLLEGRHPSTRDPIARREALARWDDARDGFGELEP